MDAVNISVVIPWRDSGDVQRRRDFAYTLRYYKSLDVGQVVVVDAPTRRWNRSAAYNRGLEVSDGDVIVWNEADTLVPASQLARAVHMADAIPGMVVPFMERHELDRDHTDAVFAGADPFTQPATKVYLDGRSIGACGVTSRATVEMVGGWDEGFSGWGYDDTAMFHVFRELAGPPKWVEGRGVHLWHAHALRTATPEEKEHIAANKRRSREVMALSGDALRAYLSGPSA